MQEIKKFRPQEAAQFVLDDIKNDTTKLEALQRVPKTGSDYYVGNRAFHEVYGTPIEGRCDLLDSAFREKVYRPLRFEVIARQVEDIPSDAWMINYLGKLVKQL